MRNKLIIGVIVLCVIAAAFILREGFLSAQPSNDEISDSKSDSKKIRVPKGPYLMIDDTILEVEIASTSEAVKVGLSGRPTLEKNRGMLFVFPKPYIYSFWMPNMQFPLDIIWINEGKVVDIDHEVLNNFDPAKPVFYTPISPAKYVLEVNAGVARANNIQTGSSVTFFSVE